MSMPSIEITWEEQADISRANSDLRRLMNWCHGAIEKNNLAKFGIYFAELSVVVERFEDVAEGLQSRMRKKEEELRK